MVKLNLGCGLQCPKGWINIDSSMGVRLAKYPLLKNILYDIIPRSWGLLPNVEWQANTVWMDMTKKFTYGNNSVDYIYSSHTFEHLFYQEAKFAFSECYRILKPNGIIRIVVPDFEGLVDSYIGNKTVNPREASYKFHKDSGYFEHPVPDTLLGMLVFYFKRKNNHSFLYDETGLRKQMEDLGFVNIERKIFQQSNISNISEIDIESRFANALCLEAMKK